MISSTIKESLSSNTIQEQQKFSDEDDFELACIIHEYD